MIIINVNQYYHIFLKHIYITFIFCLGAEKALFRALKTKKDTPKYGLLYHAPLVASASTKNKGKISRSLAAKASLATRVDAFGEDINFDMGIEHRAKLELRLRFLEEGNLTRLSGTGKVKSKFEKYHAKSEVHAYKSEFDSSIPSTSGKKRKHSEVETPKKLIEEIKDELENDEPADSSIVQQKKKKKKDKSFAEATPAKVKEEEVEAVVSEKKKKKKKNPQTEGESSFVMEQDNTEEVEAPTSEKKKKKKKSKDPVDDE